MSGPPRPAAPGRAAPTRLAPPRGWRGFTLLEVMVALAVLAGALVVSSDVVSGALRNHARAQHLEVATLLARGKMAALEDLFEWRGFRASDEHDEGSFEDEGHPEVKWRLEVVVPPLDATRSPVGRRRSSEKPVPPPAFSRFNWS